MNNGFIAIDKPEQITSFDVIRKLRKILKIKKIGHAGTLDPFATGILPIAIGEYTKLLEFVANANKTYEFTMKFGVLTNTMDIEGEIIETNNKMPSFDDLKLTIPNFLGDILQTPPIYSAIKINGKRAYDLARKGIDFAIPERPVKIYSLEIINYCEETKEATFVTQVSKGTYIRSLAHDIAKSLGSICHLNYLRRKEFGKINEINTISLEKLEYFCNNGIPIDEFNLSISNILDDIPVFEISNDELLKIKKGQFLSKNLELDTHVTLLLSFQNQVICVAKYQEGLIKPKKNLNL